MKPPSGIAFLLSRLGTHVAGRFAQRLAEYDLTPAHVGVLRVVGQTPGLSQQAVADRLSAAPSRLVKLVDELEDRGLIERRRSATDRRSHELYVASGAADRMAAVRKVVRDHDADVSGSLSASEVETLRSLLAKVAAAQGLDVEGYQPHASPPERPA